MKSEFLDWDDKASVELNPVVNNGINTDSVQAALEQPVLNLWSPLSQWSHQLDVTLFGLNPDIHHLVNLVYHLLCGLALWWMLGKIAYLKRDTPARVIISLLFLVHPAQVEAWAWISARKDLLCALFAFLSIGHWLQYLQEQRKALLLKCFLFFILSLLAKPLAVIIPFFLLFYSIVTSSHSGATLRRKQIFALLLPFLICSTLLMIYTMQINQSRAEYEVMSRFSYLDRAAIGFSNYFRYALRAFYPFDLSYFYLYPQSLPFVRAIISCGVFLGLLVTYRRWRHSVLATFSISIFVLFLVPTVGFIISGEAYGPDRYGYIANVGLFILIGVAISKLLRGYSNTAYVKGMICLLIVGLASLAVKQASTWRNMITLTDQALLVNKSNYKAYFHRGIYIIGKGERAQGMEWIKQTYELRPDHNEASIILGYESLRSGDYNRAEHYLRNHLKYWKSNFRAEEGLAEALIAQGEYSGATEALAIYEGLFLENPKPLYSERIDFLKSRLDPVKQH